jgi:hypothetical protein
MAEKYCRTIIKTAVIGVPDFRSARNKFLIFSKVQAINILNA